MKEQMLPRTNIDTSEVAVRTPRMVESLTTHSFPPTLGIEGNIFSMDAGRPTEGLPIAHQKTPETRVSFTVFPEQTTEKLLQETGIDRIKTPDQLKTFVTNFQEESSRSPLENPFKDWSIDRLKKQYLAWHVNASRIENQKKTFGEKEAIGGFAHPYSAALLGELESREVDTRELFLEATKRASEVGVPMRSIGASQPPSEEPPRRRPEEMRAEETVPYLEELARGGEARPPGPPRPPAPPGGPAPQPEREPERPRLNPRAFAPDLGLSGMVDDANYASGIPDPNLRLDALNRVFDQVTGLFTGGQLNTDELIRQSHQISNYLRGRSREAHEEIARQRLAAEAEPPRGMTSEDYELFTFIRNDNIEAKKRAVDADPNFPTPDAKITEKERLMGEGRLKIRDYIRTLNPSGSPLDTWIIRGIINYEHDPAFEYLVNRIISHPVEAETKRYQPTFYGGINFSLITEAIKGEAERLRTPEPGVEETREVKDANEERALELEGLRTKFHQMEAGTEFMHNLNRAVVMGAEREFVTLAAEMIPDHFQVLQRAKLASNVMRIFDEEIQRVMARDRLITMKNYAEVTGTIFDERGTPAGMREGTVEKLLTEINERLPQEDKLDPWELKWAFYAGRNLLNITIRTAELIAHSSGTEIGYKSFPQESIARIIDPIDLTGERFEISRQRGGLRFTEMARKNFREEKKHHGWDEGNIVSILGMDRKKFEETGILSTTGVFSGWRQNNIFYLDVPDVSGRLTHISIEQFLKSDTHNPLIETPQGQKRRIEADPTELRNLFLQNGELKPHFEHSLGVLLRLGQLLPDEKDSPSIVVAKKEVRTAIWKRIARENPLAMANILYGMQLKDNPALNQRLNNLSSSMYAPVSTVTGEKQDTPLWESLRTKLTIVQEEKMRRLSQETRGEKARRFAAGENVTFVGVMADLIRDRKISTLPGEFGILREIQSLGDSLSGELAEVRFPSNPIMNDVMFETANYNEAGTEFYKRRVGGDLVQFYEGGGKIIEVMVDPSGANTDQVLAAMKAMVMALANPNGLESGQNDVAPVFMAYLDFIREGGPTPEGKLAEFASFFLKEGAVRNAIKRGIFRRGTSLAQQYAGIRASSHTIFEMEGILDQALKDDILRRGRPERSRVESVFRQSKFGQGLMRVLTKLGVAKQEEEEGWGWTDLYERFRKKFKAKAGWKLSAWIRDMLLVFGAGAFVDFSQRTAREKA